MAAPLARRTVPHRVRTNSWDVRQEQRKPNIPGFWVYVGIFIDTDDPGNEPPLTNVFSPPWLNGWDNFGANYVAFRHGLDGDLEFQGVLDTTGMTSGTNAFRLPGRWRPDSAFSFLTDMDIGGDEFSAARITVATDGFVKVYFPITLA